MHDLLSKLGFSHLALAIMVAVFTAISSWAGIWLKKNYKEIINSKSDLGGLKSDIDKSQAKLDKSVTTVEAFIKQKEAECSLVINEKIGQAEAKLENMFEEFRRSQKEGMTRAFQKVDSNRKEIDGFTKKMYDAMEEYDKKLEEVEDRLRKSSITKGEYEKAIGGIKEDFLREIMSMQQTITKMEVHTEKTQPLFDAVKKLVAMNKNVKAYDMRFEEYEIKIRDLISRIGSSELDNNKKHTITQEVVKKKFQEIDDKQSDVVEEVKGIVTTHSKKVNDQIGKLKSSKKDKFGNVIKKGGA